MRKRYSGIIGAMLLALAMAGVANAQLSYSDATYTSMADASSSASIPPGTTITLQNWQQYKQFMPASLLAGYGQQYGWKMDPTRATRS